MGGRDGFPGCSPPGRERSLSPRTPKGPSCPGVGANQSDRGASSPRSRCEVTFVGVFCPGRGDVAGGAFHQPVSAPPGIEASPPPHPTSLLLEKTPQSLGQSGASSAGRGELSSRSPCMDVAPAVIRAPWPLTLHPDNAKGRDKGTVGCPGGDFTAAAAAPAQLRARCSPALQPGLRLRRGAKREGCSGNAGEAPVTSRVPGLAGVAAQPRPDGTRRRKNGCSAAFRSAARGYRREGPCVPPRRPRGAGGCCSRRWGRRRGARGGDTSGDAGWEGWGEHAPGRALTSGSPHSGLGSRCISSGCPVLPSLPSPPFLPVPTVPAVPARPRRPFATCLLQ